MGGQDDVVLPPGTRIDQYVKTGLLGRGGFGITYLVHDAALRKDFALKEFFPEDFVFRESVGGRVRARPDSEKEYQWGLRKFYDEARLLVQFSHPNIVGVRRVFEANNSVYMLLDLIKGTTLETWLRDLTSAPTQEELDLIVTPLLSALELAHENRTWHLDISPDNIMIRGSDGVPILLDFGASRFEMKQRSQLMSAMVYKSGYSAPEQYTSNANRYGPWTDVYAVGATLYRGISGDRPPEAPLRQLGDEQKPASAVASERYRERFLTAVDWALKLGPEERPQSVAEWRKALVDTRPVQVDTPAAALPRVTRPPRGEHPEMQPYPAPPAVSPRTPLRWVMVVALVLAGLGGASILAMQDWQCLLTGSSCPVPGGDADLGRLRICLDEKRASAPCEARACLGAQPSLTRATPLWPRAEELLASAEKACQEHDDLAARRARECADAMRSPATACEMATTCFASYLADYPLGRARSEFDSRVQQATRDCEAANVSGRQAEDRLFDSALTCAAASDGCKVPVCFQPYLASYPSGRHVGRAQTEIVKARCISASAIRNGVYLARTQQGCGPGQSVRIAVTDGRLAWQHDAQGTTFQWDGTVDVRGDVRATVRGVPSIQARGRWHDADRTIEMTYPTCGKVSMTIYQMLQ